MATREPLMIYTVSDNFIGGVNSGVDPGMLPANQLSWAENCTVRGGPISQRPGFNQLSLTGSIVPIMERLNPQGFEFYERNGNRGYLIVAAGGRLFRLDVGSNSANCDEIGITDDNLNDQARQIFMVQAGEYMVFQDGSSIPVIYDGANSVRSGVGGVPVGSGPMAFGMGRLWVAQGREYVAGDIEGGDTGVLQFTENDYQNEGGSFSVPTRSGAITAMTFTAAPNTALGQGELLITTPDSVYSTVLPTDRTLWKTLTDPVQRIVLINNGSLSQSSTTIVNGDVFMRSRDGIRSVIQAVRNFSQLGNVPISREVSRTLSSDPSDLLSYTSAITFDNRLLMTTGAGLLSGKPYFKKLAVLDFDLVSSMGNQAPAVWDGVWSGLNFVRITKGRFKGEERAFAIAKNTSKGFVSRVVVTAPETITSVTAGIILTVTGGGGTDAEVTMLCRVTSATIFAGGTGYVVGDVLSLTALGGARQASWIVTSVSAGAVTGISLINGGSYVTGVYAASLPTVCTGVGINCRVTTTCELYAIDITYGGDNYSSIPTITGVFSGTGAPCTNLRATAFLEYEWELWEITKTGHFDRPLDASDVAYDQRITSKIESPAYVFQTKEIATREKKKLVGGQLWVNDVRGDVDWSIAFKPDSYACWIDWHSFETNSLYKDCTTSVTCAPKSYLPHSLPYLNLPTPPVACDTSRSVNLGVGRTFQTKIEWTGSAKLSFIELKATAYAEENTPPCVPATETATGLECTDCGL